MRLFETARQAPLFFIFLLSGAVLGVIYELFGFFRNNKILLVISDVIYAVIFTAFTGVVAYFFNKGEMHWYFYLGEVCGLIIEHKTLGFFIKVFMDFLRKILYNLRVILK